MKRRIHQIREGNGRRDRSRDVERRIEIERNGGRSEEDRLYDQQGLWTLSEPVDGRDDVSEERRVIAEMGPRRTGEGR